MVKRTQSPTGIQYRIFFMDVDGVLTDGSMYYSDKGEVMKRFHTRDGMGIALLQEKGIVPVILTKENSVIVQRRAEKLHIQEVHVGVQDKLSRAIEILHKYGISREEGVYIGDDLNDIPLLQYIGFPCCPEDAVPQVRAVVKYVCTARGGAGAVREVIDFILQSGVPVG